MKRLGMTVGVLAVLVAVCYAAPARADEQDSVRKLREDVSRLQKQLDDLQTARELERQIGDRERKALRERLRQIEDDLDRLRGRLNSTSRRQFSFDPSAETGTVVLRNQLDVPATVTIGGTSYVVPARRTRTLNNAPVGTIRYTVTADGFGVTVRDTTVSANDPLTITVFDNRFR